MLRPRLLLLAACVGACQSARPQAPFALRKVVLYQNGIGHFEHAGAWKKDRFALRVRRAELDDVLKTLTVVDRTGRARTAVAILPGAGGDAGGSPKDETVAVEVVLTGGDGTHDLTVAYAVPAPAWKPTYRIAVDDEGALLQAWAVVDNVTDEAWRDVGLTLAAGAPMTFASDLHSPRWVPRPDATGTMVSPAATAPVRAERAQGADVDHDGVVDAEDRCPMEPESFNGYGDEDGCPDRGRVIVEQSNIRILEHIYFTEGSDRIARESLPILDEIAATLKAHPEITAVDVEGHADGSEEDTWSVAARRAAAVRSALRERGVTQTLVVRPFGATRPIAADDTADGRARNRRVELRIAQRAGDEDQPADGHGAYGTAALAASAPASAPRLEAAGAVRYALAAPVTIPRRTSVLVSMVNERVPGEDVLLFRPDAGAPGTDVHPFRAVRMVNASGLSLEPGPVAVFAGGSFVGEGIFDRLRDGQTTFVPYAVETSTLVRVDESGDEEPVRLASIARGVLVVENADIRRTTYTVSPASDPPRRIFLRHPRRAGYRTGELPPGSVETADAWLVPIPLTAGKPSELTLEDRRPVERRLAILDADVTALGVYLTGEHAPKALRDKGAEIIRLRREFGRLEDEMGALRVRLGDVAARAEELRETLRTVAKTAGAEPLRKKLLDKLAETVAQTDAAARDLATRSTEHGEARAKLAEAIAGLSL